MDIEFLVGDLLIKKSLTIATAESCTGGLLAGRLINYPGISSCFFEGAITYSNEAKMKRLGVKKETLDYYGAVSPNTAEEMARGIAKTTNSDIGLSTTGIAGPGGGTDEKPVGLVYIGIYMNGIVKSKELRLKGGRQQVRIETVNILLNWLKEEIELT